MSLQTGLGRQWLANLGKLHMYDCCYGLKMMSCRLPSPWIRCRSVSISRSSSDLLGTSGRNRCPDDPICWWANIRVQICQLEDERSLPPLLSFLHDTLPGMAGWEPEISSPEEDRMRIMLVNLSSDRSLSLEGFSILPLSPVIPPSWTWSDILRSQLGSSWRDCCSWRRGGRTRAEIQVPARDPHDLYKWDR